MPANACLAQTNTGPFQEGKHAKRLLSNKTNNLSRSRSEDPKDMKSLPFDVDERKRPWLGLACVVFS